MEVKELLKSLEKDLVEVEKKGVELSGRYVLIVDSQEDVNVSGRVDTELLVNAVWRLFEILQKESPGAAYIAEGILKGAFSQKKKDAD
ncbi:MAG: hypothetical protein E7K64_10355 [Clostridia bacterium]|nr:hypothetical protein [Clostridia bacterium]